MIIFTVVVAAFVCFVFTLFSGYWALEFAGRGSEPQHEFACKQLTAAAWVFGVLTVTILVMGGIYANTYQVPTPATVK